MWRRAGAAIVFILAARLCFLFVAYAADNSRSIRPQIETGALLFVVAGLGLRAITTRAPYSLIRPAKWPRFVPLAFMCGLALLLYLPVLRVGYLSDDFILAQHASAWQLGAVAPQLFRPLPLAVWAVLVHAGGGPVALHVLNLLLHALNALLTVRVVSAWVPGRLWPVLAGMLMLMSPLAPEAVAWGAGMFDVMSTTFVLLAVLAAREYETTPAATNRFVLVALCAAALLSKESAAITPVLIALDGWIRDSLSKRLIRDLLAIAIAIGFVAVIRLQSGGPAATRFVSKYRLQRITFDSFGTLANPWHVELFQSPYILSIFSGLSVVVLLTAYFLMSGSGRSTKTVAASAIWVLASLIPVLPLFYVSPALEGSRYLYLATVGWAGGLASIAADLSDSRRIVGFIVLTVATLTIVVSAYATRVHLQPWVEAGTSRDRILSAAVRNDAMRACDVVSVRGLPQSVKGAYVFTNGAREAFAGIGLNVYVRQDDGTCAFTWNNVTSQFQTVGPGGP